MAHGESFIGNLEIVLPNQSRRTKTPVNLRGLD
jgi:hypothetical protein